MGKVVVFLLGIVLPFVFLVRKSPNPIRPPFELGIPTPPPWVFLALLAIAALLRLTALSTYSGWPSYDDSAHALYAANLVEQWDGSLRYTHSQYGGFYIWFLAGIFKLFGPSLTTLYLAPALLSLGAVIFAWAATRKFFPSSFAFGLGVFMAFSFGPLFSGRFSVPYSHLIFWECFCFWLLGLTRSAANHRSFLLRTAFLGAATGAGFYIFHSWPVMALVLLIAWIAILRSKRFASGNAYAAFWVPLILLFLPLGIESLKQGTGSHWHTHSLLNNQNAFQWISQAFISFSYFTVQLWGSGFAVFNYGPSWGGFLNPLLGALFLLGLVEIFRSRRSPLLLGFAGAFVLLTLPGFVTRSPEMVRIALTFPAVLFIALLGLGILLPSVPSRRRFLVFGLIAFLSAGLDTYHLWGPARRQLVPTTINPHAWQARVDQTLLEWKNKEGPGLIFTRFLGDTLNIYYNHQGLFIASYPFNAMENPRLNPQTARWAALIVSHSQQKALKQSFPDLIWVDLTAWRQIGSPDGIGLALFHPRPEDRPRLETWREADRRFRWIMGRVLKHPDTMNPRYAFLDFYLRELVRNEADLKKDPFLYSVLWEKIDHLRVIEPKEVGYLSAVRTALDRVEDWRKNHGPGILLSCFTDRPTSRLTNLFLNEEGMSASTPLSGLRWAAVITDVNYLPFLSKLFPKGRSWDLPSADVSIGGRMIWFMPLDETSRPAVQRWQEAARLLSPLDSLLASDSQASALRDSLKTLDDADAVLENDPFLRSWRGDILSEIHAQSACLALSLSSASKEEIKSILDSNWKDHVEALEKAARTGWPAAHLYDQLGLLYLAKKDDQKAGTFFRKALAAPGNRTAADQHIKILSDKP